MEYTIKIKNNTTGEIKTVNTNGFVTIVLEKKKLYMSSPDAANKILSGSLTDGTDVPLDFEDGVWNSSDGDSEDIGGTKTEDSLEDKAEEINNIKKKKKPNKRELKILQQRIKRMGDNH